MRILLIIIALAAFFTGCYYDNEESLFPELPGDCDTSNVTYSGDVQRILLDYCLECHSNAYGATLGGNIQLEDHADLAAQSDLLIGAIRHDEAYSPMPKGGNKLAPCDILKIETWINQGKAEN